MAHVVERLPSKQEALSLAASTPEKEKEIIKMVHNLPDASSSSL
jgi:hypothetical protein